MSSRIVFGIALCCLALFAQAQPYPNRPVTLIVPFTPGTGPDILARLLGAKFGERWAQNVVVENKPGASGNIGADAVAKSAPNGYTLMQSVNTFVITPGIYKNLPYDPLKDFTHIVKVAVGNLALVVNPTALPVKNLDELVAAAKAQPGKIFYGSPGNGTPQHLAVALLNQRLGINLVHVPYKGAAGANTDLLGGQIQVAVLPVHTALPFAKAGRLHVIAVSGERRSVLAPDSPSFAELGLKNLDIDLYFFISGPAGTPSEVVARIQRDAGEVMALPDVRETLLKQGMVPSVAGPDEITATIKADIERWKQFVTAAKITAD